jgi:flavin reductase (DIM6/NTAB) family NADH-FMN oxidoreductase RutF
VKTLLKKWITGISIPQEYVCAGRDDLPDQLSVSVTIRGKKVFADVSARHLFLGYKPVVIAIVYDQTEEAFFCETEACIQFTQGKFEINSTWRGFVTTNRCVARLSLEVAESRVFDGRKVIFYRGTQGTHTFISSMHRLMNDWIEKYRRKSDGNVHLNTNLYEQVRIAYAVPRVIAAITVYDGDTMNLFPTDLHGPMGSLFYAGSLRIGGEACKQVEKYGRIVISEVDASRFRQVYALGKRHMKAMTGLTEFELDTQRSETFGFPLPLGVGVYWELEVNDHFDLGIHRIFMYKIINTHRVRSINTLTHVHHYYAQWRMDKKQRSNYLFR